MNNPNNGNIKNQSWDFDYVSSPQELIFEKLKTSQKGLTDKEARERMQEYGLNELAKKKKAKTADAGDDASSYDEMVKAVKDIGEKLDGMAPKKSDDEDMEDDKEDEDKEEPAKDDEESGMG